MKLSEKVAYLKGLADGLKMDEKKAETQMFNGILDVLDSIAETMDLNANDLAEMVERVDEIDMDLGDVEAILFEGFDMEELTEDDLDDWGEEPDEEAFAVVYTTEDLSEEEPLEEEEDAFAIADEVVAAAEAAEAAEEAAEEAPAEEPAVEESVEEVPAEEPAAEETAEEEPAVYEVECPECGEVLFIDDTVLAQGGIDCPKCHQHLEFEIEYED